MKRFFLILLCLIFPLTAFTGCEKSKITDASQNARTVLINGIEADTVEAAMGAFQGKQGDYIEFKFNKPQTVDTFFIIEKSTSVRQFNIYIETDGKYKLVYTGKNILNEEIKIQPEAGTAVKVEIVNTDIQNNEFQIQSISIYNSREVK